MYDKKEKMSAFLDPSPNQKVYGLVCSMDDDEYSTGCAMFVNN